MNIRLLINNQAETIDRLIEENKELKDKITLLQADLTMLLKENRRKYDEVSYISTCLEK